MSTALSSVLRAGTSLVLAITTLAATLPALPKPAAAADPIQPALKSVDQVKSEAKRYDEAVAAIAALAGATIEKPEQMSAAIATLEKHAPSLKLAASRLTLMALEDKTFMAAIAKKMSDTKSADAFTKEVSGDLKAICKVDGAAALQTRMTAALEASSEKLEATARKLEASAEKATGREDLGGKVAEAIAAGALVTLTASALVAAVILGSAFAIVLAPVAVAGIIGATIAAFGTAMIGLAVGGVVQIVVNATTEEGQDQVAACQANVDAARGACLAEAARQPALIRQALELVCWADWAKNSARCWAS